MRRLLYLALLGTCAWASPLVEDQQHLHQVETEHGPIDGIREHTHDGKNVVAYYGIPYAQAPIGELRFEPPQELEGKTDEVFHADHRPAACFQNTPLEWDKFLRLLHVNVRRPHSEDCLKLNIWLPDPVPEKATTMVYFHEGGWHCGSMDISNGAELAAEGGVIVVTIASRLGALGYLSLGDSPGNMGLMDQQMALSWIHKNIAAFGGDPAKVTLFGQGLGASAVAYQFLSPGSKGLFSRNILMSGSILHRMAHYEKAKVQKTSKKLAYKMGYSGDKDEQHLLEFLRMQDPQDIMDANEFSILTSEDVLGPIFDGTFIESFDSGLHEHPGIDVMLGTVADEGSMMLLSLAPSLITRYSDGSITRGEFITIMKEMDRDIIDHRVASALLTSYVSKHPHNPSEIRDGAVRAVGDYFWNCPAERLMDIYAETNPNNNIYRYIYDNKLKSLPPFIPNWVGSFNGLDKLALFGQFLRHPDCAEECKKFTREVIHHFTNFAKNGDPNLERDADQGGVHWPKYDTRNRSVMILSPDHDKIENHPGSDKCGIMRHLVPVVSHAHECLYDEKLKWHEENKLHA